MPHTSWINTWNPLGGKTYGIRPSTEAPSPLTGRENLEYKSIKRPMPNGESPTQYQAALLHLTGAWQCTDPLKLYDQMDPGIA